MTYSTLEMSVNIFFKFDLVGGETMSFGENFGRQGITA